MHVDIIDLREFYARPLGTVVRRLIAQRVRAHWRDVSGMNVFGLGYATPYLGVFRSEAACIGALMPASQGVIAWPQDSVRQAALVDEENLPLPDNCVDRLLVVHGIETTESTRDLLREAWRVLTPGGRLIMVVPNRAGIWARLDTTPFGHGRPYSRGQITKLLRNAMFTPKDWGQALYMPPFNWSILLRSAVAWERVGTIFWPGLCGVILVEATKQIYSATPIKTRKTVGGRFYPVPAGIAAARQAQFQSMKETSAR